MQSYFYNVILPPDLLISLQDAPGFDATSFIEVHAEEKQVHSIRLNKNKLGADLIAQKGLPQLSRQYWSMTTELVPWNADGYYLSERPKYTLDPLLHAGTYYVQEASGMFINHILRQVFKDKQNLRALDCCAAPGGKSTLLAAFEGFELVLANEVISNRVSVLYENVVKWGTTNLLVSQNDPADLGRLNGFFDCILVDAPCSGSGLFRRDPGAMNEWSLRNVEICSARQRRILDDVKPALKENGILIYSTCSYSTAENEAIVDYLVQEHGLEPLAVDLPVEWNIVHSRTEKTGAEGYRFYPDKVKGEGLFVAVLRNTKHEGTSSLKYEKFEKAEAAAISILQGYVKNPTELFYFKKAGKYLAVPAAIADILPYLASNLNLRKAGVLIGQIVKNNLVPDHELALNELCNEGFPKIEIELEMSLRFLRKENILPLGASPGWYLITFNGQGLGWMKIMPNRANNYYPVDWRILMK